MSNIEKVFDEYTSEFMSDKKNINGFVDKYHHSYFVKKEALSVDKKITRYNSGFKTLLEIQSLYHDIGRFSQLQTTGIFYDSKLAQYYKGIDNHGELGAVVMRDLLLRKIFPSDNTLDEEIIKVIKIHTQNNKHLLQWIKKEYIDIFRNYGVSEFFKSDKAENERKTLTALNTAIIQDANRLDILRKIVNGSLICNCSNEKIDKVVWNWFFSGHMPSINELKSRGYWNTNVSHLIRMDFINQMCLVPELQKIKDEFLIEQMYFICGNELVKPAYEHAIDKMNKLIEESEDKILVKR